MSNVIKILLTFVMFFGVETAHDDQLYHNVGMRQLSASIPNNEIAMQMMVWYPTLEKVKKIKMRRIEMEVAEDAKVKVGNRSLIAISHGTGGSCLGHRDTACYLALKGYIVVAVTHPQDNYKDNSSAGKRRNWVNRPEHISVAIDTVLNHNEFRNFINKDSIGIIGHSAGGYTALALIGGKANTDSINSHCREHTEDTEFCGRPAIFSTIIGYFSSPNPSTNTIIENTRDHRIKAAVLMTPVGVLFNEELSLSEVHVPIRIYRAEKDKVLLYPFHAEAVRKKLSKNPEYIVVKNAGHYSFISPFPESLKDRVGEVAMDPKGFNRIDFHKKMNGEIAEFFFKSLL